MTLPPYMRRVHEGTLLELAVQPRASRNAISGMQGDRLKIRLTAPPVEGEANKECIRYLASVLDVAKSDLELVQGHKSRRKTILVRNLSPETLAALLHRIIPEHGREQITV